jgi:hypothetical protein
MTSDAIDADFGPPLERGLAFDANAHARGPAGAGDGGAEGPAPADAAFEGSAGFADALRQALRHAHAVSARRLCWCDADFAAWPLGDAEWIELLTRWSRAGTRELVMVAGSYEAIVRLHPRFAAWRRDFAHVVRCLVPEESHVTELPTLWIDSADQAVRVFDREHWRGRAGFERVDRQHAREEFDAIAQRATAGFATVTLGL